MTKDQLIEIAKVGFPERVKQFINFENCEIVGMCGVYRLYDKDIDFVLMLPREEYIAIFIGANKFVQITVGNKAFNHYAAIIKMLEMGLI